MNKKADFFFNKTGKWQKEFEKLRSIILDCGLTEELKWGVPCYTFNNGNIILMHGFKNYCAVLFMKGALLNDSKGILIQQSKNTQSARQIRFTEIGDIIRIERDLKKYIFEAIEVEKSGLKFSFKKTEDFEMPEEFKKVLKKNPAFKKAFYDLTPGRQRGYILHFSSPKQSKTRESRILKSMERIFDGKGLNDR